MLALHTWRVTGAPRKTKPSVSADWSDADWAPLGSAIRERRLAKVLTLVELAAKAGLSQPFLSQVENGRARPSLMSLHHIAEALDTTPQAFFGGPASEGPAWNLVRAKDVQTMPINGLASTSTCHVLLGGDAPFHIVEFDGLPTEFLDYFEHDGFEATYVIRGRIEIDIGGSISDLGTGDSISYPARVPHRLRAVGARPVRVLLIESKVATVQDRGPGRHAPATRRKIKR
jgi:transcriptional regulator with XRE-family HTH domain